MSEQKRKHIHNYYFPIENGENNIKSKDYKNYFNLSKPKYEASNKKKGYLSKEKNPSVDGNDSSRTTNEYNNSKLKKVLVNGIEKKNTYEEKILKYQNKIKNSIISDKNLKLNEINDESEKKLFYSKIKNKNGKQSENGNSKYLSFDRIDMARNRILNRTVDKIKKKSEEKVVKKDEMSKKDSNKKTVNKNKRKKSENEEEEEEEEEEYEEEEEIEEEEEEMEEDEDDEEEEEEEDETEEELEVEEVETSNSGKKNKKADENKKNNKSKNKNKIEDNEKYLNQKYSTKPNFNSSNQLKNLNHRNLDLNQNKKSNSKTVRDEIFSLSTPNLIQLENKEFSEEEDIYEFNGHETSKKLEQKTDHKKEEMSNHKKKKIYDNIEMQKTLIYNKRMPIYKQEYYSYFIDANDDKKYKKNKNENKRKYKKNNEEEDEDDSESESENEDYVKEKNYKVKKKEKDREKSEDNIISKELNQNKGFKKRTSAPLIPDIEKEKYSKKKKSNYFNIHEIKGNEDRENEKQEYHRIKNESMEIRKNKNKNINTDDSMFDNNLNICRKQESQKIFNVSLKRDKNKKEFYIKENIFELHQDCDALKDFLNKKNEKIKERKNLFIKNKTESYIVNGSANYFKKENNEVECTNRNNNFSINVKQEELFVEKTNNNSKTKSLIDLYGADEDYYNQYYDDDIYLQNKNNNKKSNNNNSNNNNVNTNNNNNNNDLYSKEIASNSSQEYNSLSSKSNGLYSKKQSSQCLANTEIKKNNKVKINTEIDILKYNRSERMSEYTPRKEDTKGKKYSTKNDKSRNRKKKEGILKNKNGRSRTLVLKSNPKDIEENNLSLKNEVVVGRTISSNSICNNLDLNSNAYNKNNLFINNNEFNKEKIKQLLESKINKNEMKNKKDKKKKKNHDKKINDIMPEKEKDDKKKKEKEREKKMFLKKLQEKNNLYNKEYLDYEIDYSTSRRNNKDDSFEEQIEKNDKKHKKKKYKPDKRQGNKHKDAVIYF